MKKEFDLVDGRTIEEFNNDVAECNNYEETIVIKEVYKDKIEVPENAYNIIDKVQEDESVLYDYTIDEEIENPETKQEFGARIAQYEFALKDIDLAGEALKIRAKKGYDI